jgi:Holliday junction resolvasome RuvABC endonuclease subunit
VRYLALDLGTQLGYAVRLPNGEIESGSISFDYDKRIEGGGMRYHRFRKWLGDICYRTKCEAIIFEEVRRHRGIAAAHVYGGFVAHLREYCDGGTLIPYTSATVQDIKKHVTGKGRASKGDVIDAVIDLGHRPGDDNEADAIALLLYAEYQAEHRKER